MQRNHTIKVICFDLDNTLLDMNSVMIKFCHSIGINLSAAEITRYYQQANYNRLTLLRRIAGNGLSHQQLESLFKRRLTDLIQVDETVCKLLQNLKKKYALFLMTNGNSKIQRKKIKLTTLETIFDQNNIIISDEVGAKKPAPQLFEMLETMCDEQRKSILMVGDDAEKDIKAAHRMGLTTCWVSSDVFPDYGFLPTFQINHVLQLEGILPL